MITFNYRDKPTRGLELAQSILTTIYHAWMDIASPPLTKPLIKRQAPFQQFIYHFWPSLVQGTALTPQKIGLLSCWILNSLIEAESWPGHLLAAIYEGPGLQKLLVGSMQIDNLPRIPDPVSLSGGDRKVTGGLPDAPINIQKRWLRCFQGALHHSITRWPSFPVTNDPEFVPQPGVTKIAWPCYSPLVRDRLDLFIYPDANAGQPYQLTWEKFMRFLLDWSIGVAKGTDSGRSSRFVENGKLIVEVSISIQGYGQISNQQGTEIAIA